MTERVQLPPRPADGGGLPKTEQDFAARLVNASDFLLEQALENARKDERVLRSRLDHVQMKIRAIQAEKGRRLAPDTPDPGTVGY